MHIKGLYIQMGKGEPPIPMDLMRLIENLGIEGDPRGGGERQVSLIGAEAIVAIENMGKRGLCMHKFFANMVVEGLSGAELSVGEQYAIADAVIEITQVDKRCFPECVLNAEGKSAECPLRGTAFGKVIKGGMIESCAKFEKCE